MSRSVVAKWVLLALLGLAISVLVAVAAARVTSQQIGIASETGTAGDVLAPSPQNPRKGEKSSIEPPTAVPAPSPEPRPHSTSGVEFEEEWEEEPEWAEEPEWEEGWEFESDESSGFGDD